MVTEFDRLKAGVENERMKKAKTSKQIKITRPLRATVSHDEAVKRMKEFPKRKERFLATARANKS